MRELFSILNMAVSIRLRREGTKNRSFYRVVVADKRSPRDGKFIEAIGNYDPRETEENFRLDLDRVDHWVRHGARPSATVASMILKARKKVAAALAGAQ
jgi:small subunit ribosomal protein S16